MMLCMKKMISAHGASCRIGGVLVGGMLGFFAAEWLESRCSCGCGIKKKAKKAFKCIEDKLSDTMSM